MTQSMPLPKEPSIFYFMFDKQIPDAQTKEYFLCITSQSDFICVSLGNEIEIATEIYHILVSGQVTPCTVMDVLQDLEVKFLPCNLISQQSFSLTIIDDKIDFKERECARSFNQPLVG